ncbi:hypothetical protein GQ53DRAFT_746419 [Thozetella sp. PMI_491]|nr:hypothetical protein GQ53DRAFT_746419 [Thozetella sp. PMI_491]
MEPVADQPHSATTKVGGNVIHEAPNHKEDPLRFRRVQLTLRALSLLYDFACISAFAYLYDRFPEKTGRLPLALAGVSRRTLYSLQPG